MRKLRPLIIVIVVISMVSLYSAPIKVRATTSDDLIARWQFNEGSGTNVSDSSGNGHHGFYDNGSGSEHWNSSSFNSEAGYCIDFNNTEDQFVNFTDKDVFSFTDGAGNDQPFSVDFWLNLDELNIRNDIFSKFGKDGKEYSCWADNNGRIAFGMGDTDGSPDTILVRSAGGSISIGNWYHFAFTYNGNETKEGMELYLNGINAVNLRQGSGYDGMANLGIPLYIGREEGGQAWDMDGKIDEVRIWGASLSSSEVLDLFNNAPDLFSAPIITEHRQIPPPSPPSGSTPRLAITVAAFGLAAVTASIVWVWLKFISYLR